MKKYVTFVKDEEESRKVQEALFSAGFEWVTGHKSVDTKQNRPFLVIRGDDSQFFHRTPFGIFDLGLDVDDVHRETIGDLVFIESSDIISDPFQLDGATQPEKMIEVDGKEYSASTIKAALQEYVK